MHIHLSEPSLKDILTEPIVIDLMDADRVDRAEFLTMVREIAADLTSRSRMDNSKSQVCTSEREITASTLCGYGDFV
jgi:hypothetical protein